MTEFSTSLATTPQPAALIALYDVNYQCLLALCPSLRNPAMQPRSYLDDSLPDQPPLQLVFYEHTRHTATLGLACHRDGEGMEFLPDVQLRLYRDSRQVELLAHHGVSLLPGRIPEGSSRTGMAVSPLFRQPIPVRLVAGLPPTGLSFGTEFRTPCMTHPDFSALRA